MSATDRWIDANRDRLLQMVADLIAIPTENLPPTGNEIAGQRFIAKVLGELGAEIDIFRPDEVGIESDPFYWPGRDYANRPNVVATFRGGGGGRSMLFSSHMDTAPRDPLPWRITDPFKAKVEGNRLYGRGSYDMKGGLVASVFAYLAVRETGARLAGDVLIESVVDEEYGGANGTLAARRRGHQADIAILPEPTHMVVCPAHLGVQVLRLRIEGRSGMTFGGETLVNPIETAADVIQTLRKLDPLAFAAPGPAYSPAAPPPPTATSRVVAEGYGTPRECLVEFFVHFHEGLTEPEYHRKLDAFFEEHLPGLLTGGTDAKASYERVTRFLPASSIPLDHPILGVAKAAFEDYGKMPYAQEGAPLACDGFMFNLASQTPAIIFGPGGGNAHTADEYVEIEDLIDVTKIYARMIASWCA